MISNFDELPDTIEALRFYIVAGEKSIKELKNKVNKLEHLVSEAKQRLKNKENAPKKEVIK